MMSFAADRLSEGNKKILISLCLALMVLLSFQEVRNNDFINFDDLSYVTDNTHVQGGLGYEGFMWAMTTSHASKTFGIP